MHDMVCSEEKCSVSAIALGKVLLEKGISHIA